MNNAPTKLKKTNVANKYSWATNRRHLPIPWISESTRSCSFSLLARNKRVKTYWLRNNPDRQRDLNRVRVRALGSRDRVPESVLDLDKAIWEQSAIMIFSFLVFFEARPENVATKGIIIIIIMQLPLGKLSCPGPRCQRRCDQALIRLESNSRLEQRRQALAGSLPG